MSERAQIRFSRTAAADHAELLTSLYGGKGTVTVSRIFRDEGFPSPVMLALYRLPPGATEGVHNHRAGDVAFGPLDEFYYVISGGGAMTIGDDRIAISAGDYVFVPTNVPHGVENTSPDTDLTIHVIAISRAVEAR